MDKKVFKLMNNQMNQEIYAAFCYRNMASLSSKQGMNGFAKWLNIQYQEELAHSNLMYQYLVARGEIPVITEVKDPKCNLSHFSKIPNAGLQLEIETTNRINEILSAATEVKEYATIQFLQLFVNEQVEEIQIFKDLIDKFNLISDKNYFLIDVELEKRILENPKIDLNK